MRRKLAIWGAILTLAGMITGLGFWYFGGEEAGAQPECLAARPVVIDPGHGGIDGGANRGPVLEKDLVLDVALRARQYLDRFGVPVLLTRTEDVDLGGPHDIGRLRRDLNHRIRTANHCQAVLMVSLHINSAADTTERGVMIFYQESRASRDAAFVFDDILRRWPVHGRKELPHSHRGFALLRWTKAPAVLIELGFISNDADRALLTDPAYREKLAQALASAIAAIYQKWM